MKARVCQLLLCVDQEMLRALVLSMVLHFANTHNIALKTTHPRRGDPISDSAGRNDRSELASQPRTLIAAARLRIAADRFWLTEPWNRSANWGSLNAVRATVFRTRSAGFWGAHTIGLAVQWFGSTLEDISRTANLRVLHAGTGRSQDRGPHPRSASPECEDRESGP